MRCNMHFRRGDFIQHFLQEAKRTAPAAEEPADERSEKEERPHDQKGKQMEGAELADNTDRAGEDRQGTGVTVQNR